MGSLNYDGTPKIQSTNQFKFVHQGDFIKQSDTVADSGSVIVATGVIRFTNDDLIGIAWQPQNHDNPSVSGLSFAERDTDTSVERGHFTVSGSGSGVLGHDVTRAMGIHTSISHREADSTLDPWATITERKVFFLDSDRDKTSGFSDWTIFNSSGDAVGATDGTTDTDVTPSGQGYTFS